VLNGFSPARVRALARGMMADEPKAAKRKRRKKASGKPARTNAQYQREWRTNNQGRRVEYRGGLFSVSRKILSVVS
jgi:hypothetical protein